MEKCSILEHVPLSYKLYCGENGTDVAEKHEKDFFWNPSSWWSVQSSVVEFPAFSPYCIGIKTKEKYAFHLQVRVVNYWKFLQFIIGIILFLSAPSLSRNSFFHYTSGVSMGVLASLLVLIYVMSRFVPKKSASYAVLFFGYSFVLYALKAFWHDFSQILFNYMDYFLTYCVVMAFISFVICYRLGPVKNPRTFNLIQWFMQVIALLLIFFSSEYREITTALSILLLTAHFIPTRYVSKLQFIWYRFFPPKVRLLTELEYLEQGRIETEKALENLKKYCSSPDCNVWKTVSRLKDPVRFANYIETGHHFTDQELLDYNSEDCADTIESDEESESHLYNNGGYYS
ncbi:nuclear envelope integral membrane protein-like isoform X2 [Uloborus diversus]|uniref:nuclear envelope integral membrane protein-like isoform X2 n=1 Tax=Uloborus diversus TaxID=327109 RepID=UPI0024090AC5|nr:nuclear envelope integral membrane protein-like isoform X2 [Uloborus diversus]